ncbi:transcriptional regulator [Sphingomonas metalli]|uniref:Transcriptional regulator n=2 Tax=Sphingomonas metalli TaxID=1779358 RepID=A0A916X000_9SPHN|nr:transcriptional regulator [Sphingomonas metalli]
MQKHDKRQTPEASITILPDMNADLAMAGLGALSQTTRLDTFRLLVRHEPDGLPAGEVARQLDVPQNTMSAHLAVLARSGLVRSERRSRSIIYRADLDALRGLMLFLVKDCCEGRAELCHPLADELLACRAA